MVSFAPKIYDLAAAAGVSPPRLLATASKVYNLPSGLQVVDNGGALTAAQIVETLQQFINGRQPWPAAQPLVEITCTTL